MADSLLMDARPELPEWLPVKTSDDRLRALRDHHYAGGVGGKTVGQPGRRIAFVTFEGTAGWVSHWPDPQYVDHAFKRAGFVPAGFTKDRGLLVLRREGTTHSEAQSDSTESGHRRPLTVAPERQSHRQHGAEGRVAA